MHIVLIALCILGGLGRYLDCLQLDVHAKGKGKEGYSQACQVK